MTKPQDLFIDFVEFSSCGVKATGKETIRVVSAVNNERRNIILKDVCFVPDVTKNLFSILIVQNRNRNSKFKSTTTEGLKLMEKL